MKKLAEIRSSLQSYRPQDKTQIEPYQLLAEYLATHIATNKSVSADLSALEMAQLLAIIEQVKVGELTLAQAMKGKGQKILENYRDKPVGLPSDLLTSANEQAAAKISSIFPSPSSTKMPEDFVQTLEEIHSTLIGWMEKTLALANDKDLPPVYEHVYTKDNLRSSFYFERLSASTKKDALPDNAFSPLDIKRKVVTFSQGRLVSKKDDQGVVHEQMVFSPVPMGNEIDDIVAGIEAFTGSKSTTKGSLADKIINFGNQFLHAELLQEFRFATEYNGEKVEPQINLGLIKWRRMPDGRIKADISLEVFSVIKDGKIYVLNSEGTGLEEFSDSKLRKNMGVMIKPDIDRTPRLRAPIGSLNVGAELVKENGSYYLKVQKATIRYNTDKLKYARAPRPIPQSVRGLQNWAPIHAIRTADISKAEDVEQCVKILQSLHRAEWLQLKKFVNSQKNNRFRAKLAEIFVQGQIHNYIGKEETAFLEKSLIRLYSHKQPFKVFIDQANAKFGIDKRVEEWTRFFKQLKTNDRALCLQEPVRIINKLIQGTATLPQMREQLIYILGIVNEQEGFHLTSHDMEKIKKIIKAVRAKSKYPRESQIMEELEQALENLNHNQALKQETIKFNSGNKTLKEIPLLGSLEDQNFTENVLLVTKAYAYMRKLEKAIEVIDLWTSDKSNPVASNPGKTALEGSKKVALTEDGVNALGRLGENFRRVHTKLVEQIKQRNLTKPYLKGQIEQVESAINSESISESISKEPSSVFRKIIEAIKGLFGSQSKRYSISDPMNEVKAELDPTTLNSPKP